MASLNIKYSGGTKTINAKDTVPSTPYIQIKGVGYFPLQSNPSGAGVYVKQNDMIYKIQEKPKLVSWTSGTEEEITAMVNGYYDGSLTLDEIKTVWNIGDRRYINISAISKNDGGRYSVGESHRVQGVTVAILDFNHDLLATAQGEIDKALVTLGQIGCLRDAEPYGQNNSENGFINLETNGIGWHNCARRKWCNAGYYNALPSYLKTLVKQVIKSTANMTGSSPRWYATHDYCFLPSEREVFGVSSQSSAETGNITNHIGESQVSMETGGTQYSYYKTSQNRYKTPRWSNNSNHYSNYWWERSPSKMSGKLFCYVTAMGGPSYTTLSNSIGIAPHFCI